MIKFLPVLLLITGCASTSYKQEKIKKRATFDLNCPDEQIQVQELDGSFGTTIWGASGCGRRASYLMTCGAICQNPVMNNNTKDTN